MPIVSADQPAEPEHSALPEQLGRVIAWTDLTPQPWRNGGGITREIFSRRMGDAGAWLPGADCDWDLRLSIADVERPGDFSRFDGMTRILTVIEGTAVNLTVDGTIEALEKHRPFTFDGGAKTRADLPHGPIRDLNLIFRTGIVQASVTVESLSPDRPFRLAGNQYCVLLEGHAVLVPEADADSGAGSGEAPRAELNQYDTALYDAATGVVEPSVLICGEGRLAVVTVAAGA